MDEIQKELMQEGQDGITVLYFVDKIYLAHNFVSVIFILE